MGKPFSVNTWRTDPFKNYRFKVYFGTSTTPVAGVSKVTGLKRSSDVIEYKEGGNALIRKGLGRTKYDPITMERGVTFDTDFEIWANYAQQVVQGAPQTSVFNLRREVRIELYDETGALAVQRYLVHNAWVSEFQSLSDLDGGGNAVAIEHIKIECESWERDMSLTETMES